MNANVRIEDTIREEIDKSRQIIGTMQLALNRVYQFKAGVYHMVLEDHGGEMLDHFNSIEFKRNSAYIAMRVGLPYHQDMSDKQFYYIDGKREKKPKADLKSYYWAYPQKLLIFELPKSTEVHAAAARDDMLLFAGERGLEQEPGAVSSNKVVTML